MHVVWRWIRGTVLCEGLYISFHSPCFTCSSGALSAGDLEADYGNDVDFLIAKLKLAANNQSVSYIVLAIV